MHLSKVFFISSSHPHTAQCAGSLLVHVRRTARLILTGSAITLAVLLLIIQGLRSEGSFRQAVAVECP
jgi:hypothetical protein